MNARAGSFQTAPIQVKCNKLKYFLSIFPIKLLNLRPIPRKVHQLRLITPFSQAGPGPDRYLAQAVLLDGPIKVPYIM